MEQYKFVLFCHPLKLLQKTLTLFLQLVKPQVRYSFIISSVVAAIIRSDGNNHLGLDGIDFVGLSTVEVFPSGSSDGDTICVNITIIDDNILEGEQIFTLTLSTADKNVILGEAEAVISIIDQFNGSSFIQNVRCHDGLYAVFVIQK